MALHISISAETITQIGPLPITNSLISTWIVMVFLLLLSVYVTSKLKRNPGRLQMAVELIVGGLFSFFENIGGKHGRSFAPIAVVVFLFVLTSNWFGLLPGVGTIGFYEKGEAAVHEEASSLAPKQVIAATEAGEDAQGEHSEEGTAIENDIHANETVQDEVHVEESEEHTTFVPLFRAPTADLNTTVGLALISVFLIQFFGFKFAGSAYAKRFFNIKSPIFFFVGILELVSDVSKIISFGFRLFGNIFAGEVLLAVMAFLFAFFLPIPFYGLELFVGVVQALVFGMLIVVFTSIAVAEGEHHKHGHTESTEQ